MGFLTRILYLFAAPFEGIVLNHVKCKTIDESNRDLVRSGADNVSKTPGGSCPCYAIGQWDLQLTMPQVITIGSSNPVGSVLEVGAVGTSTKLNLVKAKTTQCSHSELVNFWDPAGFTFLLLSDRG